MKLRILVLLAALVTGLTVASVIPERDKSPQSVARQNNLYANAARQTVLVKTPHGQGSAFLFKRHNDKGHTRWFAWTAAHVTRGYPTVELVIHLRTEGRIVGTTVYTAKVLKEALLPGLDIALLFVDAPKDAFLAAEFADIAPALQGDFVFTCGNFLGDEYPGSISVGVVAQIGIAPKPWAILDQTTAPIYPGSSGGPIFNAQGLVLGIVVARVDSTLGFFVPVRAIDAWAIEHNLQWAVRGDSCPSDRVGKWCSIPEIPKPAPEPPKNDAWYWR